MSKSSVNEWDASDASDDDDGLKTPKTPGSAVSKASSPRAESPRAESPRAESPRAESPKYSEGSPGRYCPFDPSETDEDRAYNDRLAKAEHKVYMARKEELKTPAALAKRDADYAKLMPLFNAAGLKLPKVNDNNWWSHNHTLHTQIDEDQKKIHQDEATLRRKRDAHGAAHMFERVYHA
jgi:hypothetical protein